MKVLPLILLCATLTASAQTEVHDMDKNAHPHFDVATIKPTRPDDQSSGFHTMGERIWIENQTMATIFAFAYGIHKAQIVNAPDWFGSDHFDIRGTPDIKGQPNLQQQREMVAALLEERIGLKLHRDKHEMSRFVLQAPHGAGKLKPSAHASQNLPDQTGNNDGGKQDWGFTNNTMKDFADFLQYVVDHPVVNDTSLPGSFDFRLKWANDDAPANADNGNLPGLLTAIGEQLGLSFKSSRGPTEVLVIDHVERPSDN